MGVAGSYFLKLHIQRIPINIFTHAAIAAVCKTPKCSIRKYPANKQPAAAPKVFMEYKYPTCFPVDVSSVTKYLAIIGRVAPIKTVGINTKKNAKTIFSKPV